MSIPVTRGQAVLLHAPFGGRGRGEATMRRVSTGTRRGVMGKSVPPRRGPIT